MHLLVAVGCSPLRTPGRRRHHRQRYLGRCSCRIRHTDPPRPYWLCSQCKPKQRPGPHYHRREKPALYFKRSQLLCLIFIADSCLVRLLSLCGQMGYARSDAHLSLRRSPSKRWWSARSQDVFIPKIRWPRYLILVMSPWRVSLWFTSGNMLTASLPFELLPSHLLQAAVLNHEAQVDKVCLIYGQMHSSSTIGLLARYAYRFTQLTPLLHRPVAPHHRRARMRV